MNNPGNNTAGDNLHEDNIVEFEPDSKTAWHQEIVRETEHYFQGEIQHEQRASWLLATSGVLVAVLANQGSVAIQNNYWFTQFLIGAAFLLFALSAFFSITTILPFRGLRGWRDFFGRFFWQERSKGIDQLIQERFRTGPDWSEKDYEMRLKFHYRSHYLRFIRKAYGIVWSTRLMFFGMVSFVLAIMSIFFPNGIFQTLNIVFGKILRGT